MNLTEAAIDRNRVTLTLIALVLIAGSFAYLDMPRAEDPGFVVRTAQVVTMLPGASPGRVEQLLTDPLEKAIQEMPELDFIGSTSKAGVSILSVNVKESYVEMRPIWDALRRKVEGARGDLPEQAIGPRVNDEFGDVFGTVVSLTGEGFNYAELAEVADQVRDELLLIDQVAKVEIHGKQEERVFVEYSNARLAEIGLSPAQLANLLQAQNIIIPGGEIAVGRERIALEPTGNFESLEEIRRTVLRRPQSNELIYLRDIADVRGGYVDPPNSLVRASGQPALALAISMREGGNIIELGEAVTGLIDQLQARYPWGLEFNFALFQPGTVDRKVKDFVSNLGQAVIVVAAVMLLTLGLRTGLVVASLIPTAIVMAILVMSMLDIGLNQISLAALIIALGMLVDNAIVMAESTQVRIEQGTAARQAAIESARELKIPLLTSSLTTAAAFLPIYLAESTTGEYTAPLFTVVTITLLCSWVLALTLIPLLCTVFLRARRSAGSGTPPLVNRLYRPALLLMLRNRVLSVAVVIVLFALAIYGLGQVPKIFFPPTDKTFFKAEFEMPVGTDIEATAHRVEEIDAFIRDQLMADADSPGVTDWLSFVGNGGPRFLLTQNPEPPSPNYAMAVINTDRYEAFERLAPRLETYLFETYPDLTYRLSRFNNGPPVKSPIEIRLTGRDLDRLFDIVDRVSRRLGDTPGARNIKDDWGPRTKKLVVEVNQARARRAGLSSQDVAVSLQTGLSGIQMTEYRDGSDQIPVVLRSHLADRQDLAKLENLNVFSQATGRSVPLRQVADIRVVWEPARILRRDRLPTVTVSADLQPEFTASQVLATILPWLDERAADWPVGYRYALGGEAETSGKANQSIGAKLPIAVMIILLLLVGQFNSIRKPLIILTAIPLSMIGVTIGLIVGQSYFGFMTLLGVISLAGIVINNAIVLLERIDLEAASGRARNEAVVVAAEQRLRPILLTTATTVLGLIPLYLGGGEMWEPMALAIMFGLLFSTLLTLGLVPVLYSLLFGVSFRDYRAAPAAALPDAA